MACDFVNTNIGNLKSFKPIKSSARKTTIWMKTPRKKRTILIILSINSTILIRQKYVSVYYMPTSCKLIKM